MTYQLVADNIPREDVVEALTALLHEAKKGEITGIAFACTRPRQRYITNVAGACYKNPTFARGMVGFLSDELAGLVHRRDSGETR